MISLSNSIKSGLMVGAALTFGALQVSTSQAQDQLQEIMAIEADKDYGQYLAGDCVTCHQLSGAAPGVPSIMEMPAEHIVSALLEFQDGTRESLVMKSIADNMGNDEIAAVALYFSTLESECTPGGSGGTTTMAGMSGMDGSTGQC